MRETLSLDKGWRFHLGDIDIPYPAEKAPVYRQAKTETAVWGPASRLYNDQPDRYNPAAGTCTLPWKIVDLPHDYMIAQTPRETCNETLGFVEYKNAWYRRRFRLEEADADRRITLYFEGVATYATVYVNGCLAARHFDGHTSFEVDVTDFVSFGIDNVIAVYVDTTRHEGWWYSGGGIYRHVWLVKTENLSIDRDGVYICPARMADGGWRAPVETTLRNDGPDAGTVTVQTDILDAGGRVLATAQASLETPPYAQAVLTQELAVATPRLWDTDDPYLHRVRTTLRQGEDTLDVKETRFGFREIAFDAQKGFFLNGRPVKIKGVCCHQDYGLTGLAVPDSVQRYKLSLMREMGANGFRAVHYPHSEATMDALDEMGFLVMDETRWFSTNEESLRALEWLVKRDRNRPSVILWSIGNEEPLTLTENGRRIAQKMKAAVKRLDPSRPVTMAVSNDPLHSRVAGMLDVIGINYNLQQYDALHAQHPGLPLLASECCATGTTRGWYTDNCPARGYINAFDRDSTSWFQGREKTWKHIAARDWVCGGYQWAGVEHRGETVWPRLCSQSGAVDLYLLKKDAFYQNQSHWLSEPMIHLLPHWNHAGMEGEPITVWAYTNCEEAALFLDDRPLGRVAVEPYGHAVWQIPYRPGRLTVRGYRNGREAAADTQETTGAPAALVLRLETGPAADGYAVLTCLCADEQGRMIPDAQAEVSFDCNGGTVAATGSDIADPVPPACPDRRMRAGQCAVLIRTTPGAEKTTILARAPGLRTAFLALRASEEVV